MVFSVSAFITMLIIYSFTCYYVSKLKHVKSDSTYEWSRMAQNIGKVYRSTDTVFKRLLGHIVLHFISYFPPVCLSAWKLANPQRAHAFSIKNACYSSSRNIVTPLNRNVVAVSHSHEFYIYNNASLTIASSWLLRSLLDPILHSIMEPRIRRFCAKNFDVKMLSFSRLPTRSSS